MKVTFTVSPLFDFKTFTMASRVLTSNLIRNDKLDVSFNYGVIEANRLYEKPSYDLHKDIEPYSRNLSVSYSTWCKWIQYFMCSKEYSKKFASSINTDIVLMSCAAGLFDYPFIAELLNDGKKVLLGGSNFRFWANDDFVTKSLRSFGVKEKYLKNFIVVKGFVDGTTDLHKIIKDWKHCDIEENDFSTLWDMSDDYLQNVIRVGSKILNFDPWSESLKSNYTQAVFMLNNKCWWRKCKFCTYHLLPKMDFDEGVSAETIANNILKSCNNFGTNQVYLANDYFIFNRKNVKILEILKERNTRITIFSGIKLLENDRFLDNVNKYIDYVKIGLEAGTDFALNYVNKGYTALEAEKTFEKMAGTLNKQIHVSFNVIPDLPQLNEKEAVKSYENIARWKRIFNDFENVQATALSFAIVNDLNDNACVDYNFIRPTDQNDPLVCGRYYVYEILRKITNCDRILYDEVLPFNRFDENGNKMRSDFDIVPFDLYQEIFGLWGWKGMTKSFQGDENV